MKRIEYFCRNIRHGDPIEEQMEEAKKGGIIKSYTLTTLSAMNARRNADLCLWCDEMWSADHIHSCLRVPDNNCMFTCGIDFEVFAFVKVAKAGLRHVVVNDSQGEALVHCAEKVFEEMCDTNLGISSKEAIISSAPQMFDELSQPILSTNPGQIIEKNQDNNALISNSNNNNEIQANNECTHGHGNEETQIDGISSSLIQHSVDKFYEFRGEFDNNFVKDIQPDAHNMDECNMLDELPLPTFIQEMAEATKIVEIDAVQDDYEPASAVHGVQHDHFTQNQQLFAKLGTLEGSHFRDLVIICANGIRFSRILHSLINGCQHSKKMSHKVDKHYDGKMNSEYHCFDVSMVSSIVSDAIPHIGLINNVVLPLLWSDSDWFMGSSLSVVLGVNVCKSKVFELRYDCRSFLNIKEVHNLEKLNDEISPDVWIVTTAPNAHKVKMMTSLFNFIAIDADNVLLTCSQIAYTDAFQEKGHYKFFDPGIGVEVSYNTTLEDKSDFRGEEDKVYSLEALDPGGECLGMICEGLNYVFTSSLNRLSSKCDEGIEAQFQIFDPGLMLANVATSKPVDVSNNYVLLPCNHAYIGSDNKHSFQMKNYDLKGMKMTRITRLCQSYLALWWRVSALICIRDHLATNGSILMTMTCSCLCFDPGGLYNKFCVKILIGLLRVATCIESTSVWIFDPGDIGDLSGSTSVMSTLYPVYGTSIHSFTATNDNGIWPKEYMKTKRHIRLEKSPLLCNAFFSDCKSRRGEIIQVFIWDPGNIIMIVLELLTKSNKNVGSPRRSGASSGARANGCLLGIVKQIGCSTPLVLLENASEGAVKFTFYQRLSNYVKLVLITFDLRRTTCSNEYGWRYVTLNCDMPMIGQISSLVFDPRGQKYNLSLVESLPSRFVQTTAIFLSCCLAQLNLLQSSYCADHEGAILVFDPGGCGNGQKVMEQPKACQYGGGRRLKSKGNEDHQIYVFDPGGQLMRFVIKAMVTNSQPGVYYAMSCFKY